MTHAGWRWWNYWRTTIRSHAALVCVGSVTFVSAGVYIDSTLAATAVSASTKPAPLLVSAPCVVSVDAPTCESTDPTLTADWVDTGDTSTCTFTWTINWGDGSAPQTVSVVGEPTSGSYFAANHTYSASKTTTYAVSVVAVSVAGPCTIGGGSETFTLDIPTAPSVGLGPVCVTGYIVSLNGGVDWGSYPVGTITLGWGDGTTTSGSAVFPAAHEYTNANNYVVTLTALTAGTTAETETTIDISSTAQTCVYTMDPSPIAVPGSMGSAEVDIQLQVHRLDGTPVSGAPVWLAWLQNGGLSEAAACCYSASGEFQSVPTLITNPANGPSPNPITLVTGVGGEPAGAVEIVYEHTSGPGGGQDVLVSSNDPTTYLSVPTGTTNQGTVFDWYDYSATPSNAGGSTSGLARQIATNPEVSRLIAHIIAECHFDPELCPFIDGGDA